MTKIMSKLIVPGQVRLGREIEHEGKKLRPEVLLTVASGLVDEIKTSKTITNVALKVDGAQFAVAGYISTNSIVLKLLEQAQEKQIPVLLRIEKIRKRGVDVTKGIKELTATMDEGKKNITKIITGIYNFNSDSWLLTDEAQAPTEEDGDDIRLGIANLTMSVDDFFDEPKPQNEQPQMTPQFSTNTEERGQAYKNAKSLEVYFFIRKCEKEGLTKGLNEQYRRELSIILLRTADNLQTGLFGITPANRCADSHAQIIKLIFEYITSVQPFPDSKDKLQNWGKAMVAEIMSLWTWSSTK